MGPQGGGDGGREAERDLQHPPHPLQALFTASRASCISWQRQQQKQQQQQRWMQTTEKQCSSSVIKAQQLHLKSFHGQK